jgi:hypothetical protein
MPQDDQNLDQTGEVRRVVSNSDEGDPLNYPEDKPNQAKDLEEEENTDTSKTSRSSPGVSLSEVSSPYLSSALETVANESPGTPRVLDDVGLRKQFEELAVFAFPDTVQARMGGLMEKNNEGKLTSNEHEELRALVELSELVSILKGQARLFLHHLAQQ